MSGRYDIRNTFFTSDLHFGHKNIIKYCNRPWVFEDGSPNVDAMNKGIIDGWNSIVKKTSTTFIIGDFIMGFNEKNPEYIKSILSSLNGKKILIPGNHDDFILSSEFNQYIDIAPQIMEIKLTDERAERKTQRIIMCHYAMKTWNHAHHGSWMLYGHSHGTMPDDLNMKSIDVGIDTAKAQYRPYSYEQIFKIMSSRNFKNVDHHGSI